MQNKDPDPSKASRRGKTTSAPKSLAAGKKAARPAAGAQDGSAPPPEAPAPQAALSQRVIKKYPNRRLYDTQTSAYITLADVRELVMSRSPFLVRDAKSGEDLTRSILLQIILEEEAGGAPMFTEQVLANIIRFYGHAMQGFMGTYLEKNIQNLMEVQTKLAEQSKGISPEAWTQFMSSQAPLMQGMMGSYLEQSKTLFTQMQEQLQKQGEQMLSSFGLKR